MNTGGEHGRQTERAEQTAEQVVFVYRPTLADIQGAVRARARRTAAGRAETLLLPLLTVVLVPGFGLFRGSLPVVTAISVVTGLGVAICGVAWIRRSMARQMYSITEQYGQCRTVADDRGAATTGETMSFTADWKLFPEYVETPELFVLIGGRRAAAVAVLPKRGAQHPAGIDRLRALLDRKLRRL
ncbi:hypothetical protein ABZX75_01615 [Streptomyces sp. NPDC003038]|uniref:hypothetical protein n=1 Tax=unclassified Streptomyces TaxID=2593676 RepID=UPI0033AEDB70